MERAYCCEVHAPWRVGRKVGRTIYAQMASEPHDGDPLIGLMDTRELAAEVVEAHNRAADPAFRRAMGMIGCET